MSKTKSPITLSEVAERAGVSPITVSRALLSAPHKVRPQTRARIEKVARSLGYVPDLSASALASKRSRIIAVIVSTLGGSIFSNWMPIFQSRMNLAEYHLLVGDSQYSLEKEQQLVQSFLGRKPDAIVLTSGYHNRDTVKVLRYSPVPVLELWDLPEQPISHAVGFDNYAAGFKAGNHLATRGYKNLLFATGNLLGKGTLLTERWRRRWEGFRDGSKEYGLEPSQFISSADSIEIEGGYRTMAELCSIFPNADAVFFDSDTLAAGAVMYCTRNKIRIPSRMAICGLGGFPISTLISPTLTSIVIPHETLGSLASSIILDLINGTPPEQRTKSLEITLRVAEST